MPYLILGIFDKNQIQLFCIKYNFNLMLINILSAFWIYILKNWIKKCHFVLGVEETFWIIKKRYRV